jgi:hypothetical protein
MAQCITSLDQLPKTRFAIYSSLTLELEPQEDGTLKIYSPAPNASGITEMVLLELSGRWEKRTVNGVDLVVFNLPPKYQEKDFRSSFATVIDGAVFLGDYSPVREEVGYMFNKAYTDDVAKMMSKYGLSQ